VTVTVLGPFGSAVIASMPTPRAAAIAMVAAMVISFMYSTNLCYLRSTWGAYAIHCYALGRAGLSLLMCSNILTTDDGELGPCLG